MNKVLSITLGLVIICAVGALAYVIAMPKVGERFTEFYILGLEGKAENYPTKVVVGEGARVIVGIVNREHEETSYRVEVTIDGTRNKEVEPVVLAHGEKWEEEVSFTPKVPGDNRKVEFLLFKNEEVEPCLQPLYLWLDVTQ